MTRKELCQRLWPADTFVDFDHELNSAVARLRDALSDSAEQPKSIETVPKRGNGPGMDADAANGLLAVNDGDLLAHLGRTESSLWACRATSVGLRERLFGEILESCLKDNDKTRFLRQDGSYIRACQPSLSRASRNGNRFGARLFSSTSRKERSKQRGLSGR